MSTTPAPAAPDDSTQPSANPDSLVRVPVYYVAHPVSGDVVANLARARAWLAWLVSVVPDVAFSMPWMPYVEALDDKGPDDPNRVRGLRDDVAMVERCDGILLCGDRVSAGMQLELDTARAAGLVVVNLVTRDGLPPADFRPFPFPAVPITHEAIARHTRWQSSRIRQLQLQLEALELRLADVGNEQFGPFPIQTAEQNLTAIEAGVFAMRQRIGQLEAEVRRGEIVARAAGDRIRELERQLVEAGLREVRDNAPEPVAQRFDVGGEG